MRVDPKSLVRRLNTLCTSLMEAAVADAAGRRFFEIVPEHLLAAMLAAEATDARALLGHAEVDLPRLRGRVGRALELMRTGNQGRPVLSESLFQWLEDAWLLASLHFGASELRSGHLLLSFASWGHRYSGESFPELRGLQVEALKREFEAITGGTKEAAAGAADAPGVAAGAPGGAGGGQAGEEALRRFTTSYTEKARQGKIDPVFGRHAEIRQLAEILARRRKNNPIIVGEPGVGKTALVEGLARAIAAGDVPKALRGVELLELDMGLLQAGAGVRGEFEKRLKAVIEEVKGSARPIVLFIDEAHTIVGKENDAANLLKPALARGELRTIAATTWSEYKKYFEKDAAFARRFQPVKVDEPSEEQALVMLRGLREAYEASHQVTITDAALVAAVRLSHRYIAGRLLPDKAVDLLDTAATRVRIEHDAKPAAIVALEEQIAALERELGLLRREEREGGVNEQGKIAEVQGRYDAAKDAMAGLEGRWRAEKEALVAVEAARARLRAGGGDEARAEKRAADARFAALGGGHGEGRLIHAEVDVDAIAGVVETWTGIPAGKMRSDTLGALLSLEEALAGRVRGQESAVRVVAETLRIAAAGIQNPNTPLGVLLFVGPSGVGKTETATALADLLYGGERFMTAIAMSEFQEKHALSRLIGSPPGYVGYGEGGVLTEAVRQRPYSVVLLDECEKADLEVMNLFYQVFDKGTLSDGEGRSVDFKNTVVIMTSNLASEVVMRMGAEGASAAAIAAAIRPALSRHFKPALLARMTVVPFLPLPAAVLREITALKLEALKRRLWASHKIEAVFAEGMIDQLAARCTEAESGARNVEAILRGSLMPALSQALLGAFAAGQELRRVEIDSGESGWAMTLV
jgi:type VI secretion system protein VasG